MATASNIPESKLQTRTNRLMQWLVNWIADLGELMLSWMAGLGSISLFAYSMLGWLFTRMPRRETILPNFYQIGVLSLPVVAITGTFIGMIMAVQTYVQFRMMNMETRLGVVINMSLVRELGPVLAATMLAGRVGSSMAAELGTMRVTEQIDALSSMGANPIHYLVVPRFLACLMLIPALTIVADFMGVAGGYFYSVYILSIDSHHYLENWQRFVGHFDLFAGIFKSLFFGAAIALIGCHRGFNCEPVRGRGPRRYVGLCHFIRHYHAFKLVTGHLSRRYLLHPLAGGRKLRVSIKFFSYKF